MAAIKTRITAFFNDNRETYLLVREGESTNNYLNMARGVIDVLTLDKESADELKPAPKANQDLVKNANTLKSSVLPKTPLATLVLAQIIANEDKDRTDFVTAAEALVQTGGKKTSRKVVNGKEKTKKEKEKKQSPRNAEGTFTLADLARELKLDPRDVRAQFRKAEMVKPDGGWVFPEAKRDEIKALIKGEAPAKKVAPKKAPGVTKKAAEENKAPETKKSKKVVANKTPENNTSGHGLKKSQKATRRPSKVEITKIAA